MVVAPHAVFRKGSVDDTTTCTPMRELASDGLHVAGAEQAQPTRGRLIVDERPKCRKAAGCMLWRDEWRRRRIPSQREWRAGAGERWGGDRKHGGAGTGRRREVVTKVDRPMRASERWLAGLWVICLVIWGVGAVGC